MLYYVIEFIIIGIISYFSYYYIFMKKSKKIPMEFHYLENKYKLDLKKLDLKKLKKLVSFYNALIISITILIIEIFDNISIKMLIGFVTLMMLTLITYYFIGKHYQKKGLTKNV